MITATISELLIVLSGLIIGVGYIQSSNLFPEPLSSKEEKEYLELMKNGDDNARKVLIERNLRLVAHIAKKYSSTGVEIDDLISIGSIGLIKGINSFNPDKSIKIATYAAKCIQNEILMLFRSQKKMCCEVSLNDTIDVDKDGNPLTYIDIICTEDTIVEDIDKKMMINKALKFIKYNLDERERQILIMRYGLGNTKAYTQREVAGILGISRSYVSRIEKASLEKINKYLLPNGWQLCVRAI